MRIFIISMLAFFMFTQPIFGDTFLPDIEDLTEEITVFTLYGGTAGQELWLIAYDSQLEDDAGDLLEGIGNIVGLTPSSIYGWYRTRGDVAGDLPEEAQDYFYGIQYDTDSTGDRFSPFLATEQVRWTTDIEMNVGYFGIGSDWNVNEDLKLRGAVWNDFSDNYRITGHMNWSPYGAVEINAMAWLMLDDGDDWGLWRLRASHPVDNDLDVVFVYEDSTRSDAVFLTGFSYKL